MQTSSFTRHVSLFAEVSSTSSTGVMCMGRFVVGGGWEEKEIVARWRTRALLRAALIAAALSVFLWTQLPLETAGHKTAWIIKWLSVAAAIVSMCFGIGACIGRFVESPSVRTKFVSRDDRNGRPLR